jgi:uncharacterized protein involved in outer membrane biogenesis
MGKKILIAVGALFGLFVVAAIAVPLFVDVDKYRPQIVSKANENINGKLELGKLSLSLWGQVKVKIDGLSLTDPHGTKVFGVEDAYFHIPFTSLLAGSPDLILKANEPMVLAIKDKQGRLNFMNLVKSQPAAPAQPAAGAKPSEPSSGGSVAVPAFVARARLGVEIAHAKVTYQDLSSGLSSEFPDMNLMVHDLSLSRTADIQFWTDVDTKLGKTFELKGPIRLDGKATPQLVDSKFDHVSLDLKFDADGADMHSGDMFHKAKGVPCNAELAVTASAKEIKIEKANAKFHNAEIQSSGTISNLGGTASPVVQFQAKSNTIDFKPWNELVPMLKDYDLSGQAHFEAQANGPADKLGYKAKVGVESLSAKGPMLKEKPVINADVAVSTDKIDHIGLTFKAPGNDLEVSGSLVSPNAPKFVGKIASSGMDLDQLVDFPKPAPKTAGAPAPAAGGAGSSASGGAAAKSDIDASLAPLRENKTLAALDASLTTDIKFVKAMGIRIDGIGAKTTFKDLAFALEGFKMKVFDGNIKADFSTALKPAHPTYKFAAGVDGLTIEKAVESQLALFKNTLLGKANFTMSGSGASFNPELAASNLNAKGNLKVTDATFATIDIGKMVSDAINGSLAKAADKVPMLKGKSVPGLASNGASKYQYISSDFTVASGKFTAPNFVAKAEPNKGIDINGATAVGLKDLSLNADWRVIDTYNMTKAADINAGDVQHIIAEKGVFQYPQHVGGTLLNPQYSYGDVPAYFAKVALENTTGAATGKAKAAAAAQAQQYIKKAPPAVQQGLGGLSKKLFGH